MELESSTGERWQAVLEEVARRVNRQQFQAWFRRIRPLSMSSSLVRLAVPSHFYREWLQNYYLDTLSESLHAVLGSPATLEFHVVAEEEVVPPHHPPSTAPTWAEPPESRGEGLFASRYPNLYSDVLLNDYYNFEEFVVGPSNKLPHAAATAVAERPSEAYNPFFLHGSVGLGKTHLLQAICHHVLARDKDLKIVYLSCETFVNQFISAVKSGDLKHFRYRYRHVDLLVIDDVHFLGKKEQTQEEFFHTFNTLYNSGKQIVLSSDSPPKDIPALGERLVSRFKWGLVVEIEPPDYETRILIVRRKAAQRRHVFPSDVCEFIADRVTANIRELEGAVLKVVSIADLRGQPADLEIAQEALRSLASPPRRKITIEKILDVVTHYYDVRQTDLQSRKRMKSIAFPRQVCMYLVRLLTNHSLQETGGYFGGRDHSTVIYATDRIERLRSRDRRFKEELETLVREIQK